MIAPYGELKLFEPNEQLSQQCNLNYVNILSFNIIFEALLVLAIVIV